MYFMALLCCRHPDFEARLRDMFGPSLTAAHLKMAETPAGRATLIDYTMENGQVSKFPLLKCGDNIFVMPGRTDADFISN